MIICILKKYHVKDSKLVFKYHCRKILFLTFLFFCIFRSILTWKKCLIKKCGVNEGNVKLTVLTVALCTDRIQTCKLESGVSKFLAQNLLHVMARGRRLVIAGWMLAFVPAQSIRELRTSFGVKPIQDISNSALSCPLLVIALVVALKYGAGDVRKHNCTSHKQLIWNFYHV